MRKKVAPELMQISPRMTSTKGFTLLELMVVVAIIALMTVTVMPSVGSYFQISLNSAARDLASIIKESYNSTIMTGRVHRIVFDLKENNYWVESSPTFVLLDTKESKERDERRKKNKKNSDEASDSPFSLEKTITRKKMSLPNTVTYEDVMTQQSADPINQGLAYAHFFAHGLTEQTLIHLQDTSNHKLTLVIQPVIGQTDIYERHMSREEIFGK